MFTSRTENLVSLGNILRFDSNICIFIKEETSSSWNLLSIFTVLSVFGYTLKTRTERSVEFAFIVHVGSWIVNTVISEMTNLWTVKVKVQLISLPWTSLLRSSIRVSWCKKRSSKSVHKLNSLDEVIHPSWLGPNLSCWAFLLRTWFRSFYRVVRGTNL